jgi:hypothetical protein
MNRLFTINGKQYKAIPFDFNLACDLSEIGISMDLMVSQPMVAVRGYFACVLGGNKELAGKELGEHVIGGGDFNDLMDVISEEMEKSDFFQALAKTNQTETVQETPKAKTTKKKSE